MHPDNGVCGAANPNFFDSYNPVGEPSIGYDGCTRAFTAEADVNIGETYHIKLAVADALDDQLDTAVFLEAGSFDLGINLGDDILVPTGLSPCDGGLDVDTLISSIWIFSNSISLALTKDLVLFWLNPSSRFEMSTPSTFSNFASFSSNTAICEE